MVLASTTPVPVISDRVDAAFTTTPSVPLIDIKLELRVVAAIASVDKLATPVSPTPTNDAAAVVSDVIPAVEASSAA